MYSTKPQKHVTVTSGKICTHGYHEYAIPFEGCLEQKARYAWYLRFRCAVLYMHSHILLTPGASVECHDFESDQADTIMYI
jgi:hypothetical protein